MRYIFVVLAFTSLLFAHNLHHSISRAESVVVSFSFATEDDFSFESYEVYAPNSKVPFVVGRTDVHSRLSFLPDREGKWTVKVFSQDGHGKILSVDVDKNLKTTQETKSSNSILKALLGLVVIFGFFGLIYLKKKDKKIEKN
ncbi:hypothetical protein [Sulfurimonas sp.]|uniref:hypothetical protein n=1 Tax=Sulfurimonas sp. TaxID=2022749 RepID=UPI0026211D12|nr:hypothetical protein [Sulfurimonas sp.]